MCCLAQAAVEKLHQQLSLVGQPHSFLIKQLAAAEATAAATQAELTAAKVTGAVQLAVCSVTAIGTVIHASLPGKMATCFDSQAGLLASASAGVQ